MGGNHSIIAFRWFTFFFLNVFIYCHHYCYLLFIYLLFLHTTVSFKRKIFFPMLVSVVVVPGYYGIVFWAHECFTEVQCMRGITLLLSQGFCELWTGETVSQPSCQAIKTDFKKGWDFKPLSPPLSFLFLFSSLYSCRFSPPVTWHTLALSHKALLFNSSRYEELVNPQGGVAIVDWHNAEAHPLLCSIVAVVL